MQMNSVQSTAIRAVGYDEQSRRMTIVFVDGGAYDFCGVPMDVYEGLMNSRSKGSYYNWYIRDRYQC